jgi:FlgD Ig-like domain
MRLRLALVSLLAGACVLIAIDRSPRSVAVDPDREAGSFPSDWFAMQRAFPGETIDQDAYHAAMDQAVFERAQQELSTSSGLTWTQAGPFNIGGRVTSLAVTPGGTTVYLGSANGGVWKSVNAGVNWTPIFDHQGSSVFSIGALALQPGDPNVLYVGTGEANAANDSYDGYGLYRSSNGGGTWSYLGLGATRRIARVVVDPSNTNRIFVAAMGTQYSTNPDRGLYRSEDGGLNWTKVLFVSDSTGATDVVINPVHPETLFCATWERVRHNTYRRAFGPECRIWRSADHGTTWTVLSSGLPPPSDGVGRIALAIAPSRPSTIYAQYTTGSPSYVGLGLFRSLDGGDNWTQRDINGVYTNNFGGFSWYFGDMAVDPTDPEKIYCLGQYLASSTDGGVNFGVIGGSGTAHPDFHAIWIDPANPNRIFHGSDGGFYWSTNGGTGWSKSVDLPISQFYAGAIDPSNSSRLLGGTQDNNTLLTSGGASSWAPILGGDGFQCMVDPTNPSIVFAEFQYCSKQGAQVGPVRSINGGGSFSYPTGASATDRWNWNTPMVMDPGNHNIILCGSHRVYRSTTNGVSYTAVSGDLTSNLPSLLLYGTITTLAISPASGAIYYAGTDDGRVWRSLNSSGSWTEISAGLPVRWITRVTADPVSLGTVYVTLSGFSSDESQAHVYRSTNNGDTWTSISGNLPNAPANDILPDPSDPNTLYLATDLGVYITRNLGGTWYPFGTGMPLQAVFDLTLHQGSRKLVAATHGRSQWSIDLSTLPVAVGPASSPMRLALSAPAPNPSRAIARLDFEMATAGDADVTVFDGSGRRVRNLVSGARNAGRITLAWDGLDARRQRVGAGVYFVRAQVAGASVTRRLVRVE